MKVLKRIKDIGYKQNATHYLNFERYEKECGDFFLVEAAFEKAAQWDKFNISEADLRKIKSGKKKVVRLEFEEPNKFFLADNPDAYDAQFDKIYDICPYTSEWLNKKQGADRHVPIFFPFDDKYTPKKTNKKYDVIYTGHIVSPKLLPDLYTIAKFKHCFVSNSSHELVTHQSVSYEEKMSLVAQSKIALVHNLLYPKPRHMLALWTIPGFKDNEAFKLVPGVGQVWNLFKDGILVPQLKSRLFEAAFGRALILCKRDPFNVIERFFEPEKEFIYFDDHNLESQIKKILKNYDKYAQIAERAFQRARKEYTTEAFVKKYLKKIK